MSDIDIKKQDLNPALWEFPKSHAIKAIGLSTDPIESILLEILKEMGLTFETNQVKATLSKNSKYISVTVKTLLRNEQEVTHLYQNLFKHPLIVRAL